MSDLYYPDPDAARYLSMDEAVEIYHDLKAKIAQRAEEARSAGKPFRIFVLEGHGSKNAMAYEMMLADIGKRMGIQALAVESSEPGLKAMQEDAVDWSLVYKATTQTVIKSAMRKGMKIAAIDNLFADDLDYKQENARWDQYTKEIAQPLLQRAFGMPELHLQVTADPNPASSEYHFRLENLTAPLSSWQQKHANEQVRQARIEARSRIRSERDQKMVANLNAIGNAVVVIGKNHASGVLNSLRQAGDMDASFSVLAASDKQADKQYLLSPVPENEKELLRWANNIAHVQLCEGKDFPQENLPIFIERVIEKANQKTIGGPA
jgi:hypothetical protein